MTAPVMPFPRRFTVRASTAEEAARFAGRRRHSDQAITVIDHVDGDEVYVVVPGNVVLENTDRCARFLFRGQVS